MYFDMRSKGIRECASCSCKHDKVDFFFQQKHAYHPSSSFTVPMNEEKTISHIISYSNQIRTGKPLKSSPYEPITENRMAYSRSDVSRTTKY